MKVTLTIKTGNAAFEDNPEIETARILRYAANRLANGTWMLNCVKRDEKKLLDTNGNAVGRMTVR